MNMKSMQEYEQYLEMESDGELKAALRECETDYRRYREQPIKDMTLDNEIMLDLLNEMVAIRNILGRRGEVLK